ncbi:MAG TPA: WD40 repeat domain-containing protein [Pirellulaceae bacterium]|nr:WD40 repeat domain-containing protein [Pirellulaceae bacterium]
MWPRWLVPRFSIRTLMLLVAAIAVGLWSYLYLPDILHNRQDRLSRAAIDPYELSISGDGDPAKAPAELVAILGDSRLKHWAPVWDVAFVDKTTLFSRSRDETIRFWDTASGRQLRVLPAKVCAISGDGARLFVVSSSKADVIEVWDAVNWKREAALDLKQGKPCLGLMVNKDGSRFGAVFVESQRDCEVQVWDVEPPAMVRKFEKVRWTRESCRLDDAGKRLALYDGDLVHIWDVANGEELGTAGPFVQDGSKGVLFQCHFLSADSTEVITGDAMGQVVIWNYATGMESSRLPETLGSTHTMTFDSRGYSLFVGGGSNLHRYVPSRSGWRQWEEVSNDAARRGNAGDVAECLGTLAFACSDHSIVLVPPILASDRWPDVTQLAFDPLSRILATANRRGEISLWQIGSWQHLRTWQAETGKARQLLFTPDGTSLASMGNNECAVWDCQTGGERIRFYVNAVGYNGAISPDGKFLAAATTVQGGASPYVIRLWKIVDGTIHKTINHPSASNRGQLAFIGSDTLVMGGGKGMTVWDLAKGTLVADLGNRTIHDVPLAVHPDGKRVIMQPWYSAIEVWDITTQKLLLGTNVHGGKSLASSIAIHPGGKWAASAADNGTACLWEIDTGAIVKQWQLGPPAGFVSQVAFSPDGRYLATVNGNGTAYILRLDWIAGQ